jgi:hypothetical protein
MPRIHIRRENGGWNAVSGTEAPRHGDITLTFDHTFNQARVDRVRAHIASISNGNGLGIPPIYPGTSKLGAWLMFWGIFALVLFVATATFLYCGHEKYPGLSLLAGAVWTIAVPIYFFIEHEYIFFYYGDPSQYDQFKRVQELAAKIWVGAITVLGAIVALKL